MCKKLILLVSVVLVLDMLLISGAGAQPDLIGWWKLDEGSGDTVADLSASGNDGTINNPGGGLGAGGAVWVDDPERGMVLSFSGDNSSGAYVTTDLIIPAMTFENDFTWALWIKQEGDGTGVNEVIIGNRYGGTPTPGAGQFIKFTPTKFEYYNDDTAYVDGITFPEPIPDGIWMHHAAVKDGGTITYYRDGEEIASVNPTKTIDPNPFSMGGDGTNGAEMWSGHLSDVRLYTKALSAAELIGVMEGIGGLWPYASKPTPADGALYPDTWVSMSWRSGGFAVSHDVYMGENFDDVNDGAADTFRGNYELNTTFYVAGFPGYAYPDGLVPGTTYYWRIDEVNEAEPNSPWKGDVWSFSIPPKTSYFPDPADGAEFIDLNVQLNWTGGFGSRLHYVFFGENFDEVNDAVQGTPNGTTSYNPDTLELAKTYYWRVDEFDGVGTYKGEVWSFTTLGAVSGPNPADGAVDVKPSVVLSWDAGAVADSHEVYFGTDADAVGNATTTSPEYKGAKALGEESYDPGELTLNTAYFWRIDEVNGVNPDSPWAGNVWSFTTGDFFVIDDFEIYDANDNQIWYSWHDGLGYGAPGTADYFAGNGTGAAVGDETSPSYTEETIIHGGSQSMPIAYDNNKQGFANYSEVEHTLADQRDWTEEGVTELSLWFRGNPASVGSFTEGPVGTYTMTASGADIWNQADEFHFASKILTGPGSIVARVESVEQTDPWAKAGVMIRETLDAGSKFAAVYITPTNADGTATNGCRFQARLDADAAATSDSGVATTEQMAIVAPYWVKLERDVGGNFRGYYSSNGSTWQSMAWNPQSISMSSNVYVGLALTSHNTGVTCEAKFSNVTITGTVGPQWANQDIGIASNAAEPLYVAVSNSAGAPVVVVHNDPAAATIDTWTQWVIPLQVFADQGINLADVDRIAIGLGTRGNMTIPGGSGKMYIDDIRVTEGFFVSLEKAFVHAAVAMAETVVTSPPPLIEQEVANEGWAGTSLGDPLTLHDINMQPLFYVFPVTDQGSVAGKIWVSAHKLVGAAVPVIEMCSECGWLEYEDMQAASTRVEELAAERHSDWEVAWLGTVLYTYPNIGAMAVVRHPTTQEERRLVVDVATLEVIPDRDAVSLDPEEGCIFGLGPWLSFLDEIPDNSFELRLASWSEDNKWANQMMSEFQGAGIDVSVFGAGPLPDDQWQIAAELLSNVTTCDMWVTKSGLPAPAGVGEFCQKQPYWCSVATASMIAAYYGAGHSQTHIANFTKSGAMTGTKPTEMRKYYIEDTAKGGLGMKNSEAYYPPKWSRVKKDITQDRPVHACTVPLSGGVGHCRAAFGIKECQKTVGTTSKTTRMLGVVDPSTYTCGEKWEDFDAMCLWNANPQYSIFYHVRP